MVELGGRVPEDGRKVRSWEGGRRMRWREVGVRLDRRDIPSLSDSRPGHERGWVVVVLILLLDYIFFRVFYALLILRFFNKTQIIV